MNVLILAAGQGNRLKPLTNNTPKCLVKVLNKSILDHQLNIFKKFNFDKINIVAGYRANKLKNKNIKIFINKKFQNTNMVYSLFCADSLFRKKSDLIISYGDIVFEKSILEKLINSKAPITIVADTSWRNYWNKRMEEPLSDLETFRYNSINKILENIKLVLDCM